MKGKHKAIVKCYCFSTQRPCFASRTEADAHLGANLRHVTQQLGSTTRELSQVLKSCSFYSETNWNRNCTFTTTTTRLYCYFFPSSVSELSHRHSLSRSITHSLRCTEGITAQDRCADRKKMVTGDGFWGFFLTERFSLFISMISTWICWKIGCIPWALLTAKDHWRAKSVNHCHAIQQGANTYCSTPKNFFFFCLIGQSHNFHWNEWGTHTIPRSLKASVVTASQSK